VVVDVKTKSSSDLPGCRAAAADVAVHRML
jgi:hypothetical protein